MSFGDKIRVLRAEKGWSQDLVGMKTGVHGRHIGKYEKGKVLPNAETAIKLAKIFDVSLDYLFMEGEKDKKVEKDIAKNIEDEDLFHSFELVDQMEQADKEVIKQLVDAFIKKNQMEALLNR